MLLAAMCKVWLTGHGALRLDGQSFLRTGCADSAPLISLRWTVNRRRQGLSCLQVITTNILHRGLEGQYFKLAAAL